MIRTVALALRRTVPRPPAASSDPVPYTGDPAQHPVALATLHAWQCGCRDCADWWDSPTGRREYRAWRRQTRREAQR